MEIKAKNKIAYVILRLTITIVFIPALLMVFILLNGRTALTIELITYFTLIFTTIATIVLFGRRFYIQEIKVQENVVEIRFYKWFKRREVIVPKNKVTFTMSPLKYDYKYFDLFIDNKRIIRQFPYLDWNIEKLFLLKKQLLEAGVLGKV